MLVRDRLIEEDSESLISLDFVYSFSPSADIGLILHPGISGFSVLFTHPPVFSAIDMDFHYKYTGI